MKVQLKIIDQRRGFMKVQVYKIEANSRTFFCEKKGLIPQIKYELEQDTGEDVEIEKSMFQGWY